MQLSAASLADGIKFTTLGMALGVSSGAAVNLLADEICDSLGLHGKDESLGQTGAEMLVRAAVGSVGYVVMLRLMSNLNVRQTDSTNGAYFDYAYSAAQTGLYNVTVQLSKRLQATVASELPCCDECLNGKPCASE